jgi:cyclomaltodextrinase
MNTTGHSRGAPREPRWVSHAVWWHLYPLGFTGADTTGRRRQPIRGLAHIVQWLDYAVRLGTSGIALGPVFASATHGYDTIDYYRIDSRLGDDADFDRLVSQAHERGLRVLLDGVFNHVGRADGWRLDAAYSVPPEFWSTVLYRVRQAHPDAYLVGEVIHGDYAAIVADTGMHSVTQYELWKATWSSLNDRNFFELAWALDRHNTYLDTFVPMTFIGNHDVHRIASALVDERHLPHALVLLLTTGGTPSIYYGDEQAFHGVKEQRAGGDDAIRPAFPASPADLALLGASTYRLHQDLIGLRRRHPWLHNARTNIIELTNQHLIYDAIDGIHRIQVLLNIADTNLNHQLDGTSSILAASDRTTHHEGWIHLPAHGWAITG